MLEGEEKIGIPLSVKGLRNQIKLRRQMMYDELIQRFQPESSWACRLVPSVGLVGNGSAPYSDAQAQEGEDRLQQACYADNDSLDSRCSILCASRVRCRHLTK